MIITQSIKNIWPTVQDYINDIVLPFSAYYWSDIQSLIDSESMYDYFCATYNNRYIMYDKDNFIQRFKLIYHDNILSLYKNVQLLTDNIWEKFRKDDNLGLVKKKIDNSVTNKRTNATNKSDFNNDYITSNQSTESTFKKLNDVDAVALRNNNKGLNKNTSSINSTDKIFDNLRTNEAHYYDEYAKILDDGIRAGIKAFIAKFDLLFNSYYVPNCWQNNNHLI